MASNKLSVLSGMDPALVEAARDRRIASGASATPASVAKTARTPVAADLFSALTTRVSQGEVDTVSVFDITITVTNPDSRWVVKRNDDTWEVFEGGSDSASTHFFLSDEHLESLAKGTRTAKDLYQHGELRVDGDIALAGVLKLLIGLV